MTAPAGRGEAVLMAFITGVAAALGACVGNWVWKRTVGDDEAERDERIKHLRDERRKP